jgi:aminoglycoside phosphotransferase family enzyme
VNAADIDLRAKIECLSRPETFPDRPLAVEIVETHFAWVFLAGRFAYKLKKPLRFHDFDFTALATRRANCELEVALNRRLAAGVYIGTVPLTADGMRLSLGGPGAAAEWLVKMHRLPPDRALDRLAAAGRLEDEHLHALMHKLAHFYAGATRAPWDGRAYRRALAAEIDRTAKELLALPLAQPGVEIAAIAASLRQCLDERAELLHGRIANGRVVDAHGDLRPEHVFLTAEPQIIDCLEFSTELRLLDSASEIAFFTLECERLGHEQLAERLGTLYRRYCEDHVDSGLMQLYRRVHAFVRAKLAAWHLHEELAAAAAAHWRQRARWYLDIAAGSSPVRSEDHVHVATHEAAATRNSAGYGGPAA